MNYAEAHALLRRARGRLFVVRQAMCALPVAALAFALLSQGWPVYIIAIKAAIVAVAIVGIQCSPVLLRLPMGGHGGKSATLWLSADQPDAQIVAHMKDMAQALGAWRGDNEGCDRSETS